MSCEAMYLLAKNDTLANFATFSNMTDYSIVTQNAPINKIDYESSCKKYNIGDNIGTYVLPNSHSSNKLVIGEWTRTKQIN
jgi:hypothetical protein